MVAFPPAWRAYAGRAVGGRGQGVNKLTGWRIGAGGAGMQRIVSVPQQRFTQQIQGMPLTGGQVQTTVSAAGTATISIGPSGLGVVWYPAACNISTSTGAADNSTCSVYLGAIAAQNLQGGQSYAGGGDTVALSVPSMSPGQLLIAVWSGAVPGAIAAMNIIGTMDCLAY
jgi:hypothetical protein